MSSAHFTLQLSVGAFLDTMLTASITFFLWRAQTCLSKSDKLSKKLIVYAFASFFSGRELCRPELIFVQPEHGSRPRSCYPVSELLRKQGISVTNPSRALAFLGLVAGAPTSSNVMIFMWVFFLLFIVRKDAADKGIPVGLRCLSSSPCLPFSMVADRCEMRSRLQPSLGEYVTFLS